MNTHEFIEKSVREELRKLNFKESVCFTVATEAVEFYKQRAAFSRGVVAEVLAWAKKRAKAAS